MSLRRWPSLRVVVCVEGAQERLAAERPREMQA
jgi:hypothetical protein